MRGSEVAPWKLAAAEDEEEFLGIAELDGDDEFDDPEADDEDDLDDDDLDDEDDEDDLDDDLIDLDDEFDGEPEDKPHPGKFEG